MNGSPLAVSAAEHAAVVPQRYVAFRLNGHVWLASPALAEATVVVLAVHLAVHVRLQGFTAAVSAFQLTAAQVWPRVLLIAVVFLLSLAALGLYQLRHRASFNGVLVRVGLAVVLAEIALALIFYLAPSLLVGGELRSSSERSPSPGSRSRASSFFDSWTMSFSSAASSYGARVARGVHRKTTAQA